MRTQAETKRIVSESLARLAKSSAPATVKSRERLAHLFRAYLALNEQDQANVNKLVHELSSGGIPGLGELGAFELIGTVGEFLKKDRLWQRSG